MHYWGSAWDEAYGQDLERAVRFVSTFCRRYGRFGGQAKEKFGTLRFYAMFHHQLHDLFYPGHYFIRWGRFAQRIDSIYTGSLFDPIRRLIGSYQHRIYTLAYRLAAIRWPHLYHEIYCCADYPDLLDYKPMMYDDEDNAA